MAGHRVAVYAGYGVHFFYGQLQTAFFPVVDDFCRFFEAAVCYGFLGTLHGIDAEQQDVHRVLARFDDFVDVFNGRRRFFHSRIVRDDGALADRLFDNIVIDIFQNSFGKVVESFFYAKIGQILAYFFCKILIPRENPSSFFRQNKVFRQISLLRARFEEPADGRMLNAASVCDFLHGSPLLFALIQQRQIFDLI